MFYFLVTNSLSTKIFIYKIATWLTNTQHKPLKLNTWNFEILPLGGVLTKRGILKTRTQSAKYSSRACSCYQRERFSWEASPKPQLEQIPFFMNRFKTFVVVIVPGSTLVDLKVHLRYLEPAGCDTAVIMNASISSALEHLCKVVENGCCKSKTFYWIIK